MSGKWKEKKDTATTTQNTTTTAQNTQASTQQTLDLKKIVADLAGDHGALRCTVEKQGTVLDELKARVDALEGNVAAAKTDKVVDAWAYYPGGDTSKPLSEPTDNFWVAVQAGQTKVVQVKARRDAASGKLTALSPEEAAKYA